MTTREVEKETIKINRLFVDESKISRHLFCQICKQVLNNPIVLDCGHTFCYECVKNLLQINTTNSNINKNNNKRKNNKNSSSLSHHCPKCNEIVTYSSMEETSRDLLAYNLVMELEVKCNNNNFCPWQGKLSELVAHQEKCQKTLKIIEENTENKEKRISGETEGNGNKEKEKDKDNKITVNHDKENVRKEQEKITPNQKEDFRLLFSEN